MWSISSGDRYTRGGFQVARPETGHAIQRIRVGRSAAPIRDETNRIVGLRRQSLLTGSGESHRRRRPGHAHNERKSSRENGSPETSCSPAGGVDVPLGFHSHSSPPPQGEDQTAGIIGRIRRRHRHWTVFRWASSIAALATAWRRARGGCCFDSGDTSATRWAQKGISAGCSGWAKKKRAVLPDERQPVRSWCSKTLTRRISYGLIMGKGEGHSFSRARPGSGEFLRSIGKSRPAALFCCLVHWRYAIPAARQRAWVAILAPVERRCVSPWTGTLAERDLAGRPNASLRVCRHSAFLFAGKKRRGFAS